MATLISYASSGGDKGRCDAKCYNAAKPKCDCICGGKNHGAGETQARANTAELFEEWAHEYSAAHAGEIVSVDSEYKQRLLLT